MLPPIFIASVLLVPAHPLLYLAVFKLLTSVQLVPFHDSVIASTGGSCLPPKANAEVAIPAPEISALAVFKSLTSVQLLPFHNSVTA